MANGHPYSFGSIINGFHPDEFDGEWEIIKTYLAKRPNVEYLSDIAYIRKVWTQDHSRTLSIQKSCKIDKACMSYEELTDMDAIIFARDDWNQRNYILNHFLALGIPCFCDKPLCIESSDLDFYMQFIEKGLLYTGSGFRFAYELDNHRASIMDSFFISAYVVNNMEKYAIHILDAIFSVKESPPLFAVNLKESIYETSEITLSDKTIVRLTASPFLKSTFLINWWESSGCLKSVNLSDNFTAFRRLMIAFIKMVNTGINGDINKTYNSLNALSMLHKASNILSYE